MERQKVKFYLWSIVARQMSSEGEKEGKQGNGFNTLDG